MVLGRRQRHEIGEERHILLRRRGAGQQGLELLPPCRGHIVACELGRAAELVDEREQSAILVIGRAEIAQMEISLGVKPLRQCRGEARFADAGFAGDQHDLAVACLGPRPAAQQQVDLLVAADQRAQCRSAQGLEPALDDAGTQHLPSRHRRGDTFHLDGGKVAVLEESAEQPARARGDDDRVRLGQGLQTGGEVRRFADDRLFLRRALADQIADDHQTGGDPDARVELDGFDIEAADGVDDTQPRPDRPLGIVLVGPRIAEIDQDTVAHILGDKAVEPGDDISDSAVIRADDLAQILGIEACRQRGRADQIAEHHRQLPAFRSGSGRSCSLDGRRRAGGERGDSPEDALAVSEQHAELFEVGLGQIG